MEQPNENILGVQFDQQSFNFLSQAGKWARFISITGFVICGLLVLVGIFAGAMLGNTMLGPTLGAMGGIIFSVIYIIIALIYIFPCVFLYRFASNMQSATRNNDGQQLNAALSNLKSFFKFIGILIIIMLGFYVLVIVGAGIVGVMSR